MKLNKIYKNSFLKNTSYSLMGKVVAMGFYMLLDIACARILDVEMYAEWVFFYTILTILFYIGWLGINTSAKVFVSKQVDQRKRGWCICAALLLRVVGSILIAAIIWCVVPVMAPVLGYPDKYPHFLNLLLIAPGIVFFNSFCEFFKEIFIGMEEFKKLFLITALEYGGYFLFSIIILLIIRSVEGVAAGYVCSGCIVFGAGFIVLRKLFGETVDLRQFSRYREWIRPIMKYAIPIAVISMGGLVLIEMDTFMLGVLSTKEQVATYGIAKNLCSKATHINYALTVGSMTSFSLLTRENVKEKKRKFIKISNLNIAISAVVAAAFGVLEPLFINLLYGKEYGAAGTALLYLIPYYVLYSISNFFSAFLDFQGKARFRSLCYISIIVINLILNLLLIPGYGARGAAIATSISLLPYSVLVTVGAIRVYTRIERSV